MCIREKMEYIDLEEEQIPAEVLPCTMYSSALIPTGPGQHGCYYGPLPRCSRQEQPERAP